MLLWEREDLSLSLSLSLFLVTFNFELSNTIYKALLRFH